MTVFKVDFFNDYRLLGGVEFETDAAKAFEFAASGLERHNAAWARVLEACSGAEKRFCARALAGGHDVYDPRICRKERLCDPCPVLTARWTTEADEDCGWCSVEETAPAGAARPKAADAGG